MKQATSQKPTLVVGEMLWSVNDMLKTKVGSFGNCHVFIFIYLFIFIFLVFCITGNCRWFFPFVGLGLELWLMVGVFWCGVVEAKGTRLGIFYFR